MERMFEYHITCFGIGSGTWLRLGVKPITIFTGSQKQIYVDDLATFFN